MQLKQDLGRAIIDNKVIDLVVNPVAWNSYFHFRIYDGTIIFDEDQEPNQPDRVKFFRTGLKTQQPQLRHPEAEISLARERLLNKNRGSYTTKNVKCSPLKNGEEFFEHSEMRSILEQLGLSSLNLMYQPEHFGMETLEEQVDATIQVVKVENNQRMLGRSLTIDKPVRINGELYLLEVKGINYCDLPIDTTKQYGTRTKDPPGGMAFPNFVRTLNNITELNKNGLDTTLLIGAYLLPGITSSDGQPLGAVVRAVKCSPTVAHFYNVFEQIPEIIGKDQIEFSRYFIDGPITDMVKVWNAGFTHNGPAHEQNIRLGQITDFRDSKKVEEIGFKGIILDITTLEASLVNLLTKCYDQEFIRSNEARADSDYNEFRNVLEDKDKIAYFTRIGKDYQIYHRGISEIHSDVRNRLIDEVNEQFDLDLQHDSGNLEVCLSIYRRLSERGQVDPNEQTELAIGNKEQTRDGYKLVNEEVTMLKNLL
ncbi:hypothetical protein HOC35_05535 [Candidatus Woesearchaeota archaeon]|mgnify:CR=1 FL=1|jgi:hypothetical protein|nr:hypothetical protein [Candidatus Woesearchaeota archaeon]